MHPVRAARALSSIALLIACKAPDPPAGSCYADVHCPVDKVCVDGQCGDPPDDSGGAETSMIGGDGKLDLGGGTATPQTCLAAKSVRTTAGCEFWAADLPNAWLASDSFGHDIAADQQFAVVVANTTSDASANVDVYRGGSNTLVSQATVGPRAAHTFNLPKQSLDPKQNDGGEAYRIESDVPITAYQFQPLDNVVPVYSNDASALLPAHVLEDDYIAVTGAGLRLTMYPPESHDPGVYNAGAFVTVIATQDGTSVTFYPTAALVDSPYEGVVLNRGQTFTILSEVLALDSSGNLSGTRVLADAPIAVFGGNVCAIEPMTTSECCADHQEHQLLPVVAWGHQYVVAPPPDPNDGDANDPAVIRIVGAFDGTQLSWPAGRPDGAPTSIDAHEMAEFLTHTPVVVQSDEEHPFLVAQFLLSGGAANPNSELGDPGMIVVPSLSQLQHRYVFLVPTGYVKNYATIVAPAGTEVFVDDEPVGGWRDLGELGGSEWVAGRVSLGPGAHVLDADRAVGLSVTGYDRNVSYAYSGGSAVEVISEAPPIP